MTSKPNLKILIIRFSSIGDIVLTSPVVRCMKQQLENVEIHYFTKPQFSSILQANPYIDKIHELGDVKENIKALKHEGFDYVIDLHHNQRSLIFKTALGVKSYSFKKMNIEKWLKVNLKIDRLPKVHIVDRYLDTVSQLGIKNDGLGLDYFIPEEDKFNLSELPATHQNGYIGLVVGAKFKTKQLPLEKVIEVCKNVNQPIVLLGGKEDLAFGQSVVDAVGEKVNNACGKYSLNQSASLVRQATKVVSNDTGLMHMAAAFKKPILSLWGNTIPEFGMYPYYGDSNVGSSKMMEVKKLNCRPCSKIGYNKCPKGHFKCMNEIPVEDIINWLQE